MILVPLPQKLLMTMGLFKYADGNFQCHTSHINSSENCIFETNQDQENILPAFASKIHLLIIFKLHVYVYIANRVSA